MNKYYARIAANEILIEVQIAQDPGPAAGFISACKRLGFAESGGYEIKPAAVRINVGFRGDMTVDEAEEVTRWIDKACNMCQQLDHYVTTPADFALKYEVVPAGPLFLLNKVKEDSGNDK